jgi:DNA-binding PadR family transcriptional regulator
MRHVVEASPLSEPVFLILLSLAESAKHGYLLIKHVERLSGKRVRMSTGTLYGALRRMLEDGWIERCACDDSIREKQCYRLTKTGRDVLNQEHGRLKQLMRVSGALLRVREA